MGGATPRGRNEFVAAEAKPFGRPEWWYAIEIRHRFETRVVQQLSRSGVETFLPEREEVHRWSDRKKTVKIPLFAGYAFVRLNGSRATRLRVLQTAGVLGFVSAMGEAIPVPSEQIEHLRRLLQQKVLCSLHAFLKSGQRVRVRGGCLDGVEGVLAESGDKHLVISIDCLQRALAVRIEGYELELA
jgi:transcription termination/antitermination protein NusG